MSLRPNAPAPKWQCAQIALRPNAPAPKWHCAQMSSRPNVCTQLARTQTFAPKRSPPNVVDRIRPGLLRVNTALVQYQADALNRYTKRRFSCPIYSVVKTWLSVRKVWGSNPGLVKLDTLPQTVRHRCDVSS